MFKDPRWCILDLIALKVCKKKEPDRSLIIIYNLYDRTNYSN